MCASVALLVNGVITGSSIQGCLRTKGVGMQRAWPGGVPDGG